MIVIGNTSVLIHTRFAKNNSKSRMSFFIMHLAFADLLVGLINVPTDIAWRTTVGFYAGNVVCKVVKFLQVLVTYSSTYVLVSLSIDRYDAIRNPLNFSRRCKFSSLFIPLLTRLLTRLFIICTLTKSFLTISGYSGKRARLLILNAWGLSVIFSIPAVFLNEETMVKGHPQCWINLEEWQWRVYITLVFISLFFVPFIVISSCYWIICSTIWRKGRYMTDLPETSSPKSVVTTQRSSSGGESLTRYVLYVTTVFVHQ